MKIGKFNIILLLSGGFIFPQISHANQILKCTDSSGLISYHNDKSNIKGLKCQGTNLATIDKRKAPPRTVSSNNSLNTGALATEKVSSYEQEIRNQKRVELLRNELEQEKKQLLIVIDMMNKINKSDITQNKQLEAMKFSHQSNINTLEKELKIDTTDFTKLTSTVIPGLGILSKGKTDTPQFQIEGVDIANAEAPTSLAKEANKSSNNDKPLVSGKGNSQDKSNGLPSLELMQQRLTNLNHQRDGKQKEVEQNQHIQIKRREIPGMKVSQATQDYTPLPTPLSVPDFNIGK